LVVYSAALDLPHALVEWVTMLLVTREGDRRWKLRPAQRAMMALVYLREHITLAKIAAGFGISESTTHAYTSAVIHLFAERAPGLLKSCVRATPASSCWTAPSPSATGSATHARTTPTSTADTG
jgi:hypothetical protein